MDHARRRKRGQVNVERAREQKERKHPVQNCVLKIDLPEQIFYVFVECDLRHQEFNADQDQRSSQSHDQEADGMGQPEDRVVDPAESRCQHEQNGNELED
jgi:hypothetical protein